MAVACLKFFYSQELHKAKAFLFSFFPVQGHMALFWLLMGKAGPSVCIFCFVFVFDLPKLPPYCMGVGVPGPTGQQAPHDLRFPLFQYMPTCAQFRVCAHVTPTPADRTGAAGQHTGVP